MEIYYLYIRKEKIKNCQQKTMLKIFIVDDDEDVRRLYERLLNINSFEILPSAKDGEEAIVKFNQFKKKPDIILLDYLMPGLNGIETAKTILNLAPESNIIMISSDNSIKKTALEIGIKRFLSKVVSLEKIIQTIKEVLIEKK